MRHHGRLASSQAATTLPAERWRRALAASGAAAATAASFTDALGATLGDPPPLTAPGLSAYRLPLPPLRLRFPRKDAQVALVVCLGVGVEAGAATRLARALRDAGCSVALVLDRSGSQRARELLAENSLVECVTLSSAELRDLLFADRPQDVLEGLIATQRPMTDLSPYQTTGGEDDDKLFFSRHSELQRLSAQGPWIASLPGAWCRRPCAPASATSRRFVTESCL